MDQLLALRVFIRITEARSFAKAADSLNIPRSSVSKLLQDLEQHLGTKLIERSTRSFTITQAGETYREQALNLLAGLDDMDVAARQARASPHGRLRVDIGSSLANLVIIPALPQFRARYPDLELLLGVSDRPADLIGDGVDCVIRGGTLPDSSLIARHLCHANFVTCATPDYLSAFGAPLHPQDLEQNHRTIRYFFSSTGKTLPLQFAKGSEKYEVNGQPTLSVSESTALTEAVLTGMGIGQIFRFSAHTHIAAGRLVPILEDWTPASHPLQLVYPAARHPSAKLRVFIDWAVELFGSENYKN
ncbi:LysR family transcriptional regulator [Pseudomonas sp. Bout1]|uniref:LysR family transcriptional regulator n=1 Tax=Pseudomonas sp. Bout1 TaxID=3048600 RepID=UPI002AB37147|nr:LysR family transcriptional regulator [Pseudomonas sp. Bout1]MDY7533909.1 LysR family transcriptional regulator [Pseudomonas sp. Bout1]MEB0188492.1 LysR family transcriptional regulator [Pseudomonas sp. Bout1]